MKTTPITATPSQIMVEQLAASGIQHLFYNSGSREALFFDALQSHPDIHGVLALHEGNVTSMAGGYTQVGADPAVMVVHLGAGLAQCLGQLINVWHGSLPVVIITFAGDTGSHADRVNLDLDHSFGPTSIAAPFTKASWTIIEPEGLPQAIQRAIQVAKTPPVGPVHLAIYDRMLGHDQISTNIISDSFSELRAGFPADADIEAVAQAIHAAERPLLYVGDGVWKSGAEAKMTELVERFGLTVVVPWEERRSVSPLHPHNCGRLDQAAATLQSDLILCVGVRHNGSGNPGDLAAFEAAKTVIAIGADADSHKNLGGLDYAILADESRTIDGLLAWLDAQAAGDSHYDTRRSWAQEQSSALRARRVAATRSAPEEAGSVRPWVLAEHLDRTLEERGGGIITIEQYALPLDSLATPSNKSRNTYLHAPGASEGYGVGAVIGAKLAAPERLVVGLVGDGSLCYADSGIWTAIHHQIPVLYVIPNNGAYGIVADSFHRAEGNMAQTGQYAGVTLGNIDPVQIAAGFGMEAQTVSEESQLEEAFSYALNIVQVEKRPYLLNVQLPLGLPAGGSSAPEFRFGE